MGLASAVHHGGGIRIPLNFDLRVAPISPPVQSPRWTILRFAHPRLSTVHSVSRNRRAICFPVAHSRGMEQEDHLSTEGERITSHCYADSKEKKTQENEAYASAVKTVALWVCAAVAFGVGLGLKEGVGKASEFFAGYILEQSLSVDNLFVFVLIFKYFKVPQMYQRFEAVNLLLAAILLFSSFKPSIGVVLGFIGCKMILDFFGIHISTEASLGFVVTSLSAGVLLSLAKKDD